MQNCEAAREFELLPDSGFFGVSDVRIVRAKGPAMGEAGKVEALASARADILSVTSQAANAPQAAQAA